MGVKKQTGGQIMDNALCKRRRGAKIHLDEDSDPYDFDARIQSIRDLGEAVDGSLAVLVQSHQVRCGSWDLHKTHLCNDRYGTWSGQK